MLVVSLVILIGLGVLIFVSINRMRSTMTSATESRLDELTDARASLVEDYFDQYLGYYAAFAALPEVRQLIENPTDTVLYERVQNMADGYKASRDGMEGLFVAQADTTILVHTNRDSIGNPTVTTEADLAALPGQVQAHGGRYLKGLLASTSTGQIIAAVYVGVYDDSGDIIGYVGGGSYIDALQSKVYGMALNDIDNAEVYLLSSTRNNYIFAPDNELLGTEITYTSHLEALQQAVEKGEGMFSVPGSDGVDRWVSYKYIPSYDAVLMITDPESDVMGPINRLSMFMLILGVVILVLTVLATMFVTGRISKDMRQPIPSLTPGFLPLLTACTKGMSL